MVILVDHVCFFCVPLYKSCPAWLLVDGDVSMLLLTVVINIIIMMTAMFGCDC